MGRWKEPLGGEGIDKDCERSRLCVEGGWGVGRLLGHAGSSFFHRISRSPRSPPPLPSLSVAAGEAVRAGADTAITRLHRDDERGILPHLDTYANMPTLLGILSHLDTYANLHSLAH